MKTKLGNDAQKQARIREEKIVKGREGRWARHGPERFSMFTTQSIVKLQGDSSNHKDKH